MSDRPQIPIDEQLSIEEGKAIMAGGLGEYELRLVTSFCVPLAWREYDHHGAIAPRNGSAFFLNTGARVIGVTAQHVIAGYRESGARKGPLTLTTNGVGIQLDLDARMIDAHSGIDIATFSVTEDEVRRLGKEVCGGYQRTWPPSLPMQNGGIYYSGYPGVGTRQTPGVITFGAVCGSGVATQVNEKIISSQIERQHLTPILGDGILPENFDFRGMSGAPMITVVQHHGLRSWMLGGVIFQGPSTSDDPNEAIAGLEIIRARPAHFILPDGTLDKARWERLEWQLR
jgi:hypothetical protein